MRKGRNNDHPIIFFCLHLFVFLSVGCGINDPEKNPGSITESMQCNSPQQIRGISKEDVYDLTGYEGLGGGSAFNLVDENGIVDPARNIGNPQTNPHPVKNPENYFPKDKGSRIVIDLRIPYKLTEVYLYDRARTSDSIWIYTGTMQDWKLKASFTTEGNPGLWGWRKFTIEDSSRFVMVRFSSYEANITEMVMYGCALEKSSTQPSPTANQLSVKTMGEFLGVNCYQEMPVKWLRPFKYTRVYTFVSNIDRDTVNGYPNIKYKLTPHGSFNNRLKDYLLFADSIVHNNGNKIWYSILGAPRWMEKKGYHNHDRAVTRLGMDTEDPASYARHANMFWNLAASYGSKKIDTNLIQSTSPRFSGRNIMKEFENGNEPDAFWVGSKYCNPVEYFAISSADYDGHEKQLGNKTGIKQADPNSELIMAGFSTLDTNRLRVLKFLCNTLRNDQQFLWNGGIQYHYYSHNGKGKYPADRWNNASGGITPEEDSLRQKLAKVRDATHRIQPGVECILGEHGYDKSRTSKVSAPLIVGYNQSQSQGIMLIRSINQVAFSGFDRYILYWIKDVVDENDKGIYLTSGIIRQEADGSYHPYPGWYYINSFVHHLKNYAPEKIISEKGNVWIYKYRNKISPDSVAYFIYCPTRSGAKVPRYPLQIGNTNSSSAKEISFADKQEAGIVINNPVINKMVNVDVSEIPKIILVKEIGSNR